MGFGKQPHPIVKTATIQSNGVRIRTSSDVEARTIFDGEVKSVIVPKERAIDIDDNFDLMLARTILSNKE